jgi:UDP-N-acetylmuramoyl-L-alanyl-D-glutamate--2,6-diaminopimelate ligase
MGTIAEQFADHLIVTDDNPRTEASAKIIGDILSGVVRRDKVTVEAERARAIAHAISHAGPEDLVLVAGKGHEAFQERNGVWTPFCDVREVRGALQRYAGASS